MALSSNLHRALDEYCSALPEKDDNRQYVDAAIATLRHAEADGLAEYENAAARLLRELFDLKRMHDADAPSVGEGSGDTVAVKKR